MSYPSAATARSNPEPLARDPVGRMASDMRELHRIDGTVQARDLHRYGWSDEQIERLGRKAAQRLRERLDAEADHRAALRGDAAAAIAADALPGEAEARPVRRPTRPRTTPARALGQGRRSGDGR